MKYQQDFEALAKENYLCDDFRLLSNHSYMSTRTYNMYTLHYLQREKENILEPDKIHIYLERGIE